MKLFIIPLLCFTAYCHALDLKLESPIQKAEIPNGPLIGKAPGFFAWVVTIKDTEGKNVAGDGEYPQAFEQGTISVLKTDDIRFITSTLGGMRRDQWTVSGWILTIKGGSAQPSVTMPKSWNLIDFPDCDWINRENYQGIAKLFGRQCLVFVGMVNVIPHEMRNSEFPPDMRQSTACIDLESRLPVAVQLGKMLHTYQYLTAPTSKLTPPLEINNAAETWKKITDARARPLARP